MAAKVKPIPEGSHTITPMLVVHEGIKAIDFYKRAFGAQEIYRFEHPPGKIMHAVLKIGDSKFMLSDEMPGSRSAHSFGGTPVCLYLYLEDVDRVFNQAVAVGAKVDMALANMFWGDRYGRVTDPFGHSWSLATHKEDVAPEELRKRTETFMAQMGQQEKKKS